MHITSKKLVKPKKEINCKIIKRILTFNLVSHWLRLISKRQIYLQIINKKMQNQSLIQLSKLYTMRKIKNNKINRMTRLRMRRKSIFRINLNKLQGCYHTHLQSINNKKSQSSALSKIQVT